MKTKYATLKEFYDANQTRRQSPEADYGVHWTKAGDQARWRVSYIRDTGEIYTLRQGDPKNSPVEILGTHRADTVPEGELWYASLESRLVGWAEACPRPDSLAWLRGRLS